MVLAITQFAKNFYVATPFIHRHVDEGRGDQVAINATAKTVTYTDLARNVN
jgi:acyl-coenzyme A synthetase/AMP-(fatty) acid ligase